MDRADVVHENFLKRVADDNLPERDGTLSLADTDLSKEKLVELFHAQVTSRQLDRTSRKLQARGEAFYTIGSSGHEGNAAIAAAFRPSDMAFLHYRDAAFQIARSQQVPGQTPIWDMLSSFCTSKEDPISGGRHKVLGSKALAIPPQTSTIASHLPKAVGAAFSVPMAKRNSPEHQALPDDAAVLCSFGDASLNHSTAQGAINTAAWTSYQNNPLPLVFICEDNGIGISVKTPAGWVEANMANRPGIKYIRCNGLDMLDVYRAAKEAEHYARHKHKPVFLHMSCVRLYGHAGADVQTAYLTQQQIDNSEANDPLLHSASLLIEQTDLNYQTILDIYNSIGERVSRCAEHVIKRPRLKTAKDVMASIIPPLRENLPTKSVDPDKRTELFGAAEMRALGKPQHMARMINFALTDLMLMHPEIALAGEDVGKKGGVYGVTQRLHQRFGPKRIIDTLLDEQSILGLAIGMAHNGFLPIPEIQFLAYLHNAEDQIRGEAATLPFFSEGQYTNPMVVRVAGLGYQRGFGGHFHNDNSLAVLRDIPGLVVACPSNGLDAVLMLRECVRLAREEQRIVVIVEPIALYMTRDLHTADDGKWTFPYPDTDSTDGIKLGEIGVFGDACEIAIVTYANGYYLSRQAEKILREQHGVSCRIIDIRWLSPMPSDAILDAVSASSHILIVDECRKSGSPSEALMALFNEASDKHVSRYTAEDSFIATGPAFAATLPDRDGIVSSVLALQNHSETAKDA